MVRRRTKARPIERPGETLSGISGRGVDDGQPVLLSQEREQAFEAFSLVPNPDHAEPEIGPVERAEVEIGPAEAECRGDVLADFGSSAAGQGDDGRFSEGEAEPAQGAIGRTKIVPPFGDAMGFVDGEKSRGHAMLSEAVCEPRQSLRRRIEQRNLSGDDFLENSLLFGAGQTAVKQCRGDPPCPESGDLILHQRNEGGDDDSEPAEDESGQLKADGLPAARRQDREGIPSGEHRLHYPSLGGTEVRVTEMALEECSRFVQALRDDVGHGTNWPWLRQCPSSLLREKIQN
jgi:hypothetical protein